MTGRARLFFSRGFTLLELVVVVFIISLALAMIMPSFTFTEIGALKKQAKQAGGVLRYLYDESTSRKLTYTLSFKLDENSWGYTSEEETREFALKNGVEIHDVILPSHGIVSEGSLTVTFGPTGPDEPIILHLKKGSSGYTVFFNHLSGRTKIVEGYGLG